MTDEQKRQMRAWIQGTMDVLSAAQNIAARGSEQLDGTDGALPMHELSVAIGQFIQKAPELLAARAAAHRL